MTLRTALARLLTQMEADRKSPLTISGHRTEFERFVARARRGPDVPGLRICREKI